MSILRNNKKTLDDTNYNLLGYKQQRTILITITINLINFSSLNLLFNTLSLTHTQKRAKLTFIT